MRGWIAKDERQYKHIKKTQLERGSDEDTAQEIAARTVNKQRRSEGRTKNKTTQGTGNPNKPLQDRSVDELRNIAREMDISGRSKLTKKADLVAAIRKKR